MTEEDDRAFDELCVRTSPRLIGSLVVQGMDRDQAEDIAQESLARAWSRWPQVRRMANPEGWVFRVAFNLMISAGRRRGAEERAHQRNLPPFDSHEDVADRVSLASALASMPPRQRSVVALRFYAGFSVAETAMVMACAEGTVKSLTSQAVTRLRAHFTAPEVPTVHGRGSA